MNIYIYIIFINIFYLNVVAQNDYNNSYNNSIEFNANYFYHFMGNNTKNNFNYGFSFQYSRIIIKLKISTGINYSTKYYYYEFTPSQSVNSLIKREYKLQYFNFPFLISFNINNNRILIINTLGGLILNKVINYDLISYYVNTPPVFENNLKVPTKLGISLRIGIIFSKNCVKNINLNLGTFTDFKLVLNNTYEGPNYNDLPDNRISLGLKFGIEYLF